MGTETQLINILCLWDNSILFLNRKLVQNGTQISLCLPVSRHSMHYCLQNYYKKMHSCYFTEGGGARRGGRSHPCLLPPPPKCNLIIIPIFQSSILEESLVSIFRPRIKKHLKYQERRMKVPGAVPALRLFTTCPLLALSPWLPTSQSLHTTCCSPQMPCACPALRPGCCPPPPSAKCQKCTAFLKAWPKYHLF